MTFDDTSESQASSDSSDCTAVALDCSQVTGQV